MKLEHLDDYITYLRKYTMGKNMTLMEANSLRISHEVAMSYHCDPESDDVVNAIIIADKELHNIMRN